MAGIFKWKHIERPMILVKIEEIAVARNGINVIIYPPYCEEIPGIFVNFFVPDSIGAPLMVGGKEELSIISMNGIRILVGSGIGFVYFFSIFPDVIFLIGRNPDDIGIVSFYIQGVFCIIPERTIRENLVGTGWREGTFLITSPFRMRVSSWGMGSTLAS